MITPGEDGFQSLNDQQIQAFLDEFAVDQISSATEQAEWLHTDFLSFHTAITAAQEAGLVIPPAIIEATQDETDDFLDTIDALVVSEEPEIRAYTYRLRAAGLAKSYQDGSTDEYINETKAELVMDVLAHELSDAAEARKWFQFVDEIIGGEPITLPESDEALDSLVVHLQDQTHAKIDELAVQQNSDRFVFRLLKDALVRDSLEKLGFSEHDDLPLAMEELMRVGMIKAVMGTDEAHILHNPLNLPDDVYQEIAEEVARAYREK